MVQVIAVTQHLSGLESVHAVGLSGSREVASLTGGRPSRTPKSVDDPVLGGYKAHSVPAAPQRGVFGRLDRPADQSLRRTRTPVTWQE